VLGVAWPNLPATSRQMDAEIWRRAIDGVRGRGRRWTAPHAQTVPAGDAVRQADIHDDDVWLQATGPFLRPPTPLHVLVFSFFAWMAGDSRLAPPQNLAPAHWASGAPS
jgi:hypothetical protein